VRNYLPSKGKLLYSYAFFILATHPALATHPQNKATEHQAHTVNTQMQSDKSYWAEAQGQIDKLYKSVSTNQNILKTEQAISTQANDTRQNIVNKLTNLTKGLIYDPEHPEKLIDLLITGYTFVTNAEKPLISHSEKILGNKNQLVIEAKENCTEQLQYLNALKEQRQQILQMKTTKQDHP